MIDIRHKIGLGTVQFGLDYGISNNTGKTTEDDARKILALCAENGVDTIDTANLYGDSESVLGKLTEDRATFKIVTKTATIKKDIITKDDCLRVSQGIETSLRHLKTKSVYGLLAHHADDILAKGGEALYETLQAAKDMGHAKKIGVSAYTAEQIKTVLSKFDIDLVQVPMNVFDQSLAKGGLLTALKEKGVEIHIRSAFLQGIAFMSPDDLPEHLKGLRGQLVTFINTCRSNGWTQAQGALAYLHSHPKIDRIICGVNTPEQFIELCHAAESVPNIPQDCFDKCAVLDAHLANPSLWNTAAA